MLVQDAVKRIVVTASETGLTLVDQKLKAIDRTYDQITAGSTRAATATEAAHRRMQRAMATFNAQGIGGFAPAGARTATGAVGAVGGFAISNPGAVVAGVTAVTVAYVALNAVWERGADLVERYATAQRDLDRSDLTKNLGSLTTLQQDTISAAQVQLATELGSRLQDAKFTIDQFFKVQFDIVDPALKLQAAWVAIVELMAKGISLGGDIIATTAKASAAAAAAAVPGGGIAVLANRSYNYMNPPGEGPSLENQRRAAMGRLGAAMGVNNIGTKDAPLGASFAARFNAAITGLADKSEEEAKKVRNAWERATESLGKSISMQEAELKGIGATAGAQARLKTEAQLTEAAKQAGIKITGDYAAAYEVLADRAAKAADALAKARLQNELGFERDQLGRNDTDKMVASRLRGAGLPVDLESQEAQDIRINRALEIKRELADRDPFIALQREMESLSSLLNSGAMDWETYAAAAQKAQANTVAGMFGLGAQLATALGGIFNEQKASAYAAAVLNTAESITKTMAQYGATPWGFAAAGVAAAAGAAQIAAISRQSRKGGSGAPTAGGAGGGGGTVAPAAAATPAPTPQAVNLKLVGKWHSTDSVRELIEQMNEYMKDGGTKVYVE